ncbi:unnamed protein product [Bemisia tabaci]|uniref:60S ribosomal export protein NMD3 n=1 Tax=Bemisia tabaci TaxID=7038 RepID=A0A9P0EYZ1_BEMTA|nr:PREDICTED: 60S ribosomal export protein NMD3 [Bemisia tabaci]CAH0381717.1 unnamed protein product [Bemisia tabaci]
MEEGTVILQNEPVSEERRILCCQCGCVIAPNPANMCVACLRSKVDITESIPKQATLQWCKGCERYLQPPQDWVHCPLESRELLALCLRKLKGLSRVKLVDAGFIWTEPHSKRIKVKLTVQGEVFGGAVLEQVFVVEFTVVNLFCEDCHRTEAKNFWRACVQVRQKTDSKKTMYYLEQLILKHKAHEQTVGIKPMDGGLDFYYATEVNARKMVDFLCAVLPCKDQMSKELISHDIHSNTYNTKTTYSIEIVPVCKDSIVCLPKSLAHNLGGINQLCLVARVASSVHLIDPFTAQVADLTGMVYWRNPFQMIFHSKQLIEFIVMDIELVRNEDLKVFPGQGRVSHKHVVADVWVVKASELGINENPTHVRSHLGHLLKVGDSVLGYNLEDSNINDPHFDKLNKDYIPDVILVKKFYPRVITKRGWKLKHIAEKEGSLFPTDNNDYDEFKVDLEEDVEYRKNVNIYKDKSVVVDADDIDDPFAPHITLEEMLDDLHIDQSDPAMEE